MLELEGVSKRFHPGTPNEVRALSQVSLRLEPSSFLVVIGTNGSGKSTFLGAIAGTVKVDSGKISLAGQDITGWPEHRRAGLIGRVFQNPFAGTAPAMTVAENLALAARRGQPRRLSSLLSSRTLSEIRDRVSALEMGLEDRLDTPIGALSGGQRQALTLLMSTWVRPALLLLDEHTAALDPKTAEMVVELTCRIVAEAKLTTVMVTHSMRQAVNLGDRLIMMHRGQIVQDLAGADKKRLRTNDLLKRFDEVRRMDQLDESAAAMLERSYV